MLRCLSWTSGLGRRAVHSLSRNVTELRRRTTNVPPWKRSTPEFYCPRCVVRSPTSQITSSSRFTCIFFFVCSVLRASFSLPFCLARSFSLRLAYSHDLSLARNLEILTFALRFIAESPEGASATETALCQPRQWYYANKRFVRNVTTFWRYQHPSQHCLLFMPIDVTQKFFFSLTHFPTLRAVRACVQVDIPNKHLLRESNLAAIDYSSFPRISELLLFFLVFFFGNLITFSERGVVNSFRILRETRATIRVTAVALEYTQSTTRKILYNIDYAMEICAGFIRRVMILSARVVSP